MTNVEPVVKNEKKYEDLTFSDKFMFAKVMEDGKKCRKVLELLLRRPVGELKEVVSERQMKQTADGKTIRMDIYTEEEKAKIVYDLEMQNKNNHSLTELDLPKRSRLYQSEMDANCLDEGISYRELPENNVIFLCTFDPMNRGKAAYHFQNKSDEEPPVPLGDGAHKYYFNCAYEGEEISEELRNFYRFIQTGESRDELTEELMQAVDTARLNKEWKEDYMLGKVIIDDAYYFGKLDGKKEGFSEGSTQTVMSLLKQGKITALDAATELRVSEEELNNIIKSNEEK